MLLLLLLLSVICQAKTLTRCFVIELEQNSDFSNQNFCIKLDRRALSDNPSDIAVTSGCIEPGSPPDKKRQKPDIYGIKTVLIEPISWQWLYAMNLLVAYELILITKDTFQCPTLYSLLPLEAAVTVGWLLTSYRIGSSLFNPIEQQEANQNHPVAITTIMAGAEHNQPQFQPSQSSSQHTPQASTHITGYFTSLLYSDSGGGNEDPRQYQHTLGLNCFIYPCNGVCRLRQSSDPSNSVNGVASDEVASDEVASDGVASDGVASDSMAAGAVDTTPLVGQTTCNIILIGDDGQLRQCGKLLKNKKVLWSHRSKYHTGQKTCDLTLFGEDGQPRRCGKVYKSAQAFSEHKSRIHSGKKTCDVTEVSKDGQHRPCGKVCKNSTALSNHKRIAHSGQQTCDANLVGEDGQLYPCGKLCKNAKTLSNHRNQYHTGQKTCDVKVVGDDGQPQPCGMVCQNAKVLSDHKNNFHTSQQSCDASVVGDDGQQRLCGRVYGSVRSLSVHKSNSHTGQKTCAVTVIGEDGQPGPCGLVCKNLKALSNHKARYHSKEKTCKETVFGLDSQPRPCGKACKNVKALSDHKRQHRKRKPVRVNRDNDLSP